MGEYTRREDYDMILSIIEDSAGGQEAVLWQVKRILSTSAIVLLARVVEETTSFCFTLPFVWFVFGVSFDILTGHITSTGHVMPSSSLRWLLGLPWPLILHQLRVWRFFFSVTNVLATLSALRVVMFSGHGQVAGSASPSRAHFRRGRRTCAREHWTGGKLFVAVCICFAVAELTLAVLIVLAWYLDVFTTTTLYILTPFWALKVLPWTVGFFVALVLQCRQKAVFVVMQMKAFSAASPRIGIVVFLTCMFLEFADDNAYRQYTWLTRVPCVGLSAWASSVVWELASPFRGCPSFAWLSPLVVMAVCMPYVLIIFWTVAVRSSCWTAFEGVALWALGTSFQRGVGFLWRRNFHREVAEYQISSGIW